MAGNLDGTPFIFGPGSGWATLTTFMDGTTPTTPQPRKFDVLQDFSIQFDSTIKRLMGSNIFPRAIGVAEGKVSLKIKFARFDSGLWQMRWGEPAGVTAGNFQMADDEGYTVASGTVTVARSAVWSKDWGVRYGDTGMPLTAVVGTPLVRQYSVASGVYTFNTGDNTRPVVISYEYTNNGAVWTDRGATGAWAAAHAYVLNNIITDSNGNIEIITTAGTSGTPTAPAWNVTVGGTTTDRGPALPWAANTYYPISTAVTDSNGNVQIATTAGTSGGAQPIWSVTLAATTNDGGGVTLLMLSHPQGQVALSQLRYQGYYGGRLVGVWIPNAVGNNLNMNPKQADFTVPEMDFEAFADPSNKVAYLYMPQQS
jgi:hypothetical protein